MFLVIIPPRSQISNCPLQLPASVSKGGGEMFPHSQPVTAAQDQPVSAFGIPDPHFSLSMLTTGQEEDSFISNLYFI